MIQYSSMYKSGRTRNTAPVVHGGEELQYLYITTHSYFWKKGTQAESKTSSNYCCDIIQRRR